MLKVIVDGGEKSKELVRMLGERGIKFETISGISDEPRWPLPGIQGPLGSVYGLENIVRYFMTSDEHW